MCVRCHDNVCVISLLLFFSEEGVCAEMTMVCLNDFEEYAKKHLPKTTWDYYEAGADECTTRDDNLQAYKRYHAAFKCALYSIRQHYVPLYA